ncbi:MAG: hypothetical protein ACXV5M_14060, partial [Candidatus Angelobacter sp.]
LKASSFFLSMSFDKWLILVVIFITVKCYGTTVRCIADPTGHIGPMNLSGNKKAARSQAALCKEAKEEGKSLREGDARCSPSLRQDTRIEEVSNLGRGLKSFSFYVPLYLPFI